MIDCLTNMKNDNSVFSSDIQRVQKPLKNNLNDLFSYNPIQPTVPVQSFTEDEHILHKHADKCYVPKKKSKISKVKTVKDIRWQFEKDVFCYLSEDLAKQENTLYKHICKGSSKEQYTINYAGSLLKCDQPISRSTWQMVMNVNPEKHLHPTQFILWNGRRIRLNGSRGGDRSFICNYDIGKICGIKKCQKPFKKFRQSKKSLLNYSLKNNFKPGPLRKKNQLDESYQKHHVGNTQIVQLPKVGLEVQPLLGAALDPVINNMLLPFRESNGKITEKWATFSVSTLGSVKFNSIVQSNNKTTTFNLKYKNDQNQILMRKHDTTKLNLDLSRNSDILFADKSSDEETILKVVDDIIRAVEVSLNQDNIFEKLEEPRINTDKVIRNADITPVSKDKPKNKYLELAKLDVTVIQLPETHSDSIVVCNNSFCSYGCVCNSLKYEHTIKSHCGLIDCMFECQCDFSQYKVFEGVNSKYREMIPVLLNLDNQMNSKLAKEEKKFHQTVVVTGDESVVFKSQKRKLKTNTKYADLSSYNTYKTRKEHIRILSICLPKIEFKNIEPWCMVHNLYKCFCKGRFTQSFIGGNDIELKPNLEDVVVDPIKVSGDLEYHKTNYPKKPLQNKLVVNDHQYVQEKFSPIDNHSQLENNDYQNNNGCARSRAYSGRMHDISYYQNTNKKIKQMEINDTNLKEKLECYLKKNHDLDCLSEPSENLVHGSYTAKEVIHDDLNEISDDVEITGEQNIYTINGTCESPKNMMHLPNKTKLVSWLEANYKHYKERLQLGRKNMAMEPPKLGKIALYPWTVLLDRYKKRKNYFMATTNMPYRIFMAVDINSPFFANCIHIDKIEHKDLRNYPITVRNFLQDASDMEENFYILYGLQNCWELIGSVTKLKDNIANKKSVSDSNESLGDIQTSCSDVDQRNKIEVSDIISKWLVLLVEEDFSEIQFHNKGFFVKHSNITNAINVARVSGKTVRLSSNQNFKSSNELQFGIYATPFVNKCYVFIGPYQENEPLGVEIVKSNHPNQSRSRGVWITTNKRDNTTVIDNPLKFIPNIDECKDVITLENLKRLSSENADNVDVEDSVKEVIKMKTVKLIKPITISRHKTIFKLNNVAQTSLLKPSAALTNHSTFGLSTTETELGTQTELVPIIKESFSLADSNNANISKVIATKKPVAEIAPQIKSNRELTPRVHQQKGGMLILKPEEINNRIVSNLYLMQTNDRTYNNSMNLDEEMAMDIDNFLATSEICSLPKIIDERQVSDKDESNEKDPVSYHDVYIECKNVENMGWIKGRRNCKNDLSFQFPGFKFTDYYSEHEAFVKINQVLTRKIYVPSHINLEWRVVETEEDLKLKRQLKIEDMVSDCVLTKFGGIIPLRKYSPKNAVNENLDELSNLVSSPCRSMQPLDVVKKAKVMIKCLKQVNKDLEDEVASVQLDNSVKKTEILDLLKSPPNPETESEDDDVICLD